MKSLVYVVALLASILAGRAVAADLSVDAILDGILFVESRGDHTAVGRLGERGGYQFRKSTWQDRTSTPFRMAHDPQVARAVAVSHLDWIKSTLQAEGVRSPTEWQIAAAWNCGASAVASGRIPAQSRLYASRVLVAAHKAQVTAVAAAKSANVSPSFTIRIPDGAPAIPSVDTLIPSLPLSSTTLANKSPKATTFSLPALGVVRLALD